MQFILPYLTFLYLLFYSLLPIPAWFHGLQGQPTSFIPFKAATDTELTISNLLFRKLVVLDPFTGEIQYDLLESYEVKEDGLVYEVTLKKNQYWHDGVEITADDLLYTASQSSNLREVSSDKVDNYKVRFILPNKYSPFLSVLNLPVIPAHLQDTNDNLTPVGSGDYRAIRVKKDRAMIEDVILITTNKAAPFKKLIFKFYQTDDDLRIALKLKEVDSILFDKNENFEGYKNKKYDFFGRSYVMVFNTGDGHLTKEERRNVAQAINYDMLIDEQEYENALRPHGPFSATWADSESFEQLKFDPNINLDISKSLKFIIPNVSEARILANIIKNNLEEKGVAKVDIQALSTKDYVINVRKHSYDMVLLAQEYSLDPDRFIFWHSSQNETGLNFSNLSTIRVDRSLEEGREEQNLDKRKEHYNIFQSVFSEELPAIYLIHPAKYFYYSNKIKGLPDLKYFYPWQVFQDFESWEKAEPEVLL